MISIAQSLFRFKVQRNYIVRESIKTNPEADCSGAVGSPTAEWFRTTAELILSVRLFFRLRLGVTRTLLLAERVPNLESCGEAVN